MIDLPPIKHLDAAASLLLRDPAVMAEMGVGRV